MQLHRVADEVDQLGILNRIVEQDLIATNMNLDWMELVNLRKNW
jgi:hypothetical protein